MTSSHPPLCRSTAGQVMSLSHWICRGLPIGACVTMNDERYRSPSSGL